MSLLPIIYTSLIIFSSVLFLVLIISYISYKYKQSENVAIAGINGNNIPKAQIHSNTRKENFSRSHTGHSQTAMRRMNDQIRNYPKTKSHLYKNHRSIGDRRINVIYREKTEQKNTTQPADIKRMSIVEDISKNSLTQNNFRIYPTSTEYSSRGYSGANILRYYDDF
jgi:hypothetical protein